MTREEWTRRFADRIKDVAQWDEYSAMACAEAAAEQNQELNGDEWLDPEDDADVEMSYFSDDEE